MLIMSNLILQYNLGGNKMDVTTINILAEMGTNLTSLAVKGTATAIHSKIESLKKEKNTDAMRNTYD